MRSGLRKVAGLPFGRRQGREPERESSISTDSTDFKSSSNSSRRRPLPARKDDRAIAATASDAILSKLSASAAGYYDDPFIAHFAYGAEGLTASSSSVSSPALSPHHNRNQHGTPLHLQHSQHQYQRNRRMNVPVRSLSSPMESSSSAATSFYDYDDEGNETAGRNGPHHRGHHPPHHLHFHQHMHQSNALHPSDSTSNNFNHPLGHLSQSDIHPALRGRLATASAHPGLHRHMSAGPGMLQMATAPGPGQGQPLIRRGTHARVCVIDRALSTFLSLDATSSIGGDMAGQAKDQPKQVVLLGAGRDTSYLRHLARSLHCRTTAQPTTGFKSAEVRWFEIDHYGVMKKKLELIRTCPAVHIEEAVDGTAIDTSINAARWNEHQPSFSFSLKVRLKDDTNIIDTKEAEVKGLKNVLPWHLIGHDLRQPSSDLFASLQSVGFDPSVPTLFVLECVQMYLPCSAAESLLKGISSTCGENAIVALYEPIIGTDNFGRVMEQHLTRAGIVVPPGNNSEDQLCLTAYRTLESHLDHLASCGWNTSIGSNMLAAYESVVTDVERARANSVELLDELEEFFLIMRHYCFIVAGVSSLSSSSSLPTNAKRGGLAQQFCSLEQSALGFVEGKCSVRI